MNTSENMKNMNTIENMKERSGLTNRGHFVGGGLGVGARPVPRGTLVGGGEVGGGTGGCKRKEITF